MTAADFLHEEQLARRTRGLFIRTTLWCFIIGAVLLVAFNALPGEIQARRILFAALFGLSIPLALRASVRAFQEPGPPEEESAPALARRISRLAEEGVQSTGKKDPWAMFAGRPFHHPARTMILERLIASPGQSSADLARDLELRHGDVGFHMRMLVRAGLAERRRGGTYHPAAHLYTPEPVLARQAIASDILRELRVRPHSRPQDLSRTLHLDPRIVRRYLKDLMHAGIVTRNLQRPSMLEVQDAQADRFLDGVQRGLAGPGAARFAGVEPRRSPPSGPLDAWTQK